MGNTNDSSHSFPQIWERISNSYLKHRYTHEIIEQHKITLSSEQQKLKVLASLKKRMTLNHMNIVKLIYFKNIEKRQFCSQIQSIYRVLVYTEYSGDTLEKIAQQKGERFFYNRCQCIQILSGIEYLHQIYGEFIVQPNMIFLGNHKQKSTKIWINSKINISQRQSICNQQQMCKSLYKLFRYIKYYKICNLINQQYLNQLQNIYYLSEIKILIDQIHKDKEYNRRYIKNNSSNFYQSQQQLQIRQDSRIDRIYLNKQKNIIKANSLPQKTYNHQLQNENNNINFIIKDRIHQNQNISNTNRIIINYPIDNKHKNVSRSIEHKPSQSKNPLKIKFVYNQSQNQNRWQENIQQYPKSYKNVNTLDECNEHNMRKNQEYHSYLIDKELELHLPEYSQKITLTRQPTTQRTHTILKQQQIKIKSQVPEIIYNRYQRKIISPINLQSKISQSNNFNKFQKYKDKIQIYEKNLRHKFTTSTGGQNPSNRQKNNIKGRKTDSYPKEQYKQKKSLQNDLNKQQNRQNTNYNRLDQNSIYKNSNHEINIYQRKQQFFNNENQNDKKQNQQYCQKLILEKQLQKQKKIDKNKIEDVIKQDNILEQYRRICEKIKQKKETFFQLKAEATKILQDLQL